MLKWLLAEKTTEDICIWGVFSAIITKTEVVLSSLKCHATFVKIIHAFHEYSLCLVMLQTILRARGFRSTIHDVMTDSWARGKIEPLWSSFASTDYIIFEFLYFRRSAHQEKQCTCVVKNVLRGWHGKGIPRERTISCVKRWYLRKVRFTRQYSTTWNKVKTLPNDLSLWLH